MKRVKKYLILVLVVIIAGTSILPRENITAKKKCMMTEYYGIYDGEETGIKKVKIKKKSIVIWGSCKKYKFKEGGDIWKHEGYKSEERVVPIKADEEKIVKDKKRTFKLARNVKYLGYGSDYGPDEYTKKKFKKDFGQEPCHLGFGVKIKKGKVIEVFVAS